MRINRTALTDHALQGLQPDGTEPETWEVGDHEKPKDGGWQGDPGRSDFVPYVVLTALRSQRPSGPIGDPGSDVIFPYALTNIGSSRRQVQMMSDLAREKFRSLARTNDSEGQRFGSVDVASYGGVDRVSQDPPIYSVTDTVNVWTTT